MQIVVAASDVQWISLTNTRAGVNWLRVNNGTGFSDHKTAAAYFDLTGNPLLPHYAELKKPVIIHSVIETLKEISAPENVCRINGWPGFLQRPAWEIAGSMNDELYAVFQTAGIRLHPVADEPGFISARIIAMIVNEAYLALEDEVSSKEEIDTAMKLGTNYPFGPFEWGAAIGIDHIGALLEKLYKKSNRYKPSGRLLEEINKQAG